MNVRSLLEGIQSKRVSIDDALRELQGLDVEDLGFANLDHHRQLRRGFPEVVYCAGKTPEQSAMILERLAARQTGTVLGTRADERVAALLRDRLTEFTYNEMARTIVIPVGPKRSVGRIGIVAAGTSDLPVAEEAAVTAEAMGNRTLRIYDVGVAGLHRLLRRVSDLRTMRVIIVVAGMEGALPSVVAGLVSQPVIAVPTSVGYGAQLHGITPMLSMLTSCSPGMAVVNIDNGFGAAYIASQINQMQGPDDYDNAIHEEQDTE